MNDGQYPCYTFSDREIRALALLLRKYEDVLDKELDGFRMFLETTVYQSMTIAEAEDFFNEKK